MWISLGELLVLTLLISLALAWWQNLKKRELALMQVRRYCKQQGLQLLDESIALKRARFRRDTQSGQLQLERCYFFEFTSTGDERYQGWVVLHGARIHSLEVEPYRLHQDPSLPPE